MSRPAVTVAMLVYRDPSWLAFALEGLAWARNRTPYTTLVVGNDAEADVMATGRVDVDHRNVDSLTRIGKIYAAWNRAVSEASTELVCLINDDMAVSDYWLDELVDLYSKGPRVLPCGLLVESGRIPSAMPEYVKNFGLTTEDFDADGFRGHAESIRKRGECEPGRLYMPCLFERSAFLRLGGYPLGNPTGTTGDKDLFARFSADGYLHMTALGSVTYHVQCGSAGGYYGPD